MFFFVTFHVDMLLAHQAGSNLLPCLSVAKEQHFTQIFHTKKSLLIDKSHLQKHVETLEDTAYVHCVRYLAATSSMRQVWQSFFFNNYQNYSKKKKPYLFTLVKQKSLQNCSFFFLNYALLPYNKYESSNMYWNEHTQREKRRIQNSDTMYSCACRLGNLSG